MKPTRKVSRRSFLTQVAGGGVALGAIAVVGGEAIAQTGVTDSDTGSGADRAGNGRGTGRTDSDPTDRAGQGRGATGITDGDPTDRAGNGRGSGRTDRDPT